ncbi:GPI-anchored surface protein, putative [Bodo saltans]|uniref:GPI-anchored surface protein, putative n=1 Tax=Bodo saltans TaxID=75058 RepID=A0A0S4JRC3_BODSA|nr:GPI-anchored surface protein, putative [Bodo saltans]|eukprot:CUG93127.1 GPI-anchored surface protein, putative [Bodo saltans]
MGMWSEEELQAAVVEDDSTTLGGKDASMLSTAPTPGLLMMTPAGAAHDTLDAPPSPMVAPFDTSKNLHSSSRLRFVGSPNDSGVASRSKGGGFNSHAEYSSVQLLDALAMDLVSDRAGGSVASQMHRASASNQKRGRPKMASVLSVSSPEDDPALDYPELQDSGHQSRQLWIAAGGTAGAHLQHHGVPGGILSDGVYIPAAYGRQGVKDGPSSLTMGPGRGDDHHHPDEYLREMISSHYSKHPSTSCFHNKMMLAHAYGGRDRVNFGRLMTACVVLSSAHAEC